MFFLEKKTGNIKYGNDLNKCVNKKNYHHCKYFSTYKNQPEQKKTIIIGTKK